MSIERTAVVSSNIVSLGYDPEHLVVEVEFKGGRVYHYTGVTPEVWAGRQDSESIGRWVATVVKPQFEFEHGEFEAPEPDDEEVCPCPRHEDEDCLNCEGTGVVSRAFMDGWMQAEDGPQ